MNPDQIRDLAMDISRIQEDAYNAGVAEGVGRGEARLKPALDALLLIADELLGLHPSSPEELASYARKMLAQFQALNGIAPKAALEAGKGA